ncbi:MAG: hypothetical protein H6732_04300 [Alphaproteobacteria bacterium]|nr:hypothetical protein [Alphaproteobacteria bacterium]
MSLALALAILCAAPAQETPGLLGPAGLPRPGQHALLVTADTELSGYPTVHLGWRHAPLDGLDVGLEVGGNDVAALVRLLLGGRIWEGAADRVFLGTRLRAEFKRHAQVFPTGEFRPIDDLGFVFAPELSLGVRLGRERRHALHVYAYGYADLDVRGRPVEWFGIPGGLGYEWASRSGFHLLVDGAVGLELGNPDTAGEPIPRLRLLLGWLGG